MYNDPPPIPLNSEEPFGIVASFFPVINDFFSVHNYNVEELPSFSI